MPTVTYRGCICVGSVGRVGYVGMAPVAGAPEGRGAGIRRGGSGSRSMSDARADAHRPFWHVQGAHLAKFGIKTRRVRF